MRGVLSVLICLCLVSSTFSQTKPIDEVKVRQLVRQLENRERETRDKAETELREMGSLVLSLLPEIDARTSGEMKQRLLRIRDHLEKLQVAESARETHVTLKGKMKLSDVLAAIEKQTGNTVVDYRGRLNQAMDDTIVTVDFDQVPFWAAFDQVLDQAGLNVYTFVGEPRKLAIVAAAETALPRYNRGTYEGLFRIEPTNLTLERDLQDPAADMLRVNIEFIWEPRVLPILIRQDLADIQLLTDNDESLAVTSAGTIQLPVQPGVAAIPMRLPLQLPSRAAKEITSLKGRFTALVPGGDVTFEFTDLAAKNVQQRKGGLTVILDRVRRNGGVQQIFVRLRLDQASDSLQSHLDWVENNTVQLLDPTGQPADEPNYEKYLERDSEVGYSYIFPVEADLKGWKLIYTTPAGIAEVPIEYELKNIPLP